ncbi:hypothetical protein LY78DRAFT_661883 [Colletotrichum sublineola]|nr:hypothetical protein LY78DRAFT_661883 [Colletotrichum sublineola]
MPITLHSHSPLWFMNLYFVSDTCHVQHPLAQALPSRKRITFKPWPRGTRGRYREREREKEREERGKRVPTRTEQTITHSNASIWEERQRQFFGPSATTRGSKATGKGR